MDTCTCNMYSTVCKAARPMLHKQANTCSWRSSHTDACTFSSHSFRFFFLWSFFMIFSSAFISSPLFPQIASPAPLLYHLFSFSPKEKNKILANSPASLHRICSPRLSVPQRGFCPAARVPFFQCLWKKTHTRTSRQSRLPMYSTFCALLFIFSYCLFPIEPTTHRHGEVQA